MRVVYNFQESIYLLTAGGYAQKYHMIKRNSDIYTPHDSRIHMFKHYKIKLTYVYETKVFGYTNCVTLA